MGTDAYTPEVLGLQKVRAHTECSGVAEHAGVGAGCCNPGPLAGNQRQGMVHAGQGKTHGEQGALPHWTKALLREGGVLPQPEPAGMSMQRSCQLCSSGFAHSGHAAMQSCWHAYLSMSAFMPTGAPFHSSGCSMCYKG